MIAADVLRALGWEVEIKEKNSYWNLVLTNTTSSEDMPESHKSCLRGLLRGWLMEFNYEGGHQQVNIYKELRGLSPEDDRYSCLDTCVNRTDSNTPEHDLDDKEIFVRRKYRFDRYVLADPVPEEVRQPVFEREDEDTLTEEKVYDYYQERSTTAGSRAEQLAWMFIVMMTGVLISGHTYQTFAECAALSAIYMLLSVMQAVWQTFTSWLFMKQIRKADVMPNDYPAWVGCGAWLFFWLKMISISAAVCYFVYVIFS